MTDPIETIVADALTRAGIAFTTPADRRDPTGLDFRLDCGVEIEVKQFHSPRIAGQMASAENVIVIQGREAALAFARMIGAPFA